MVDGFLHCIEVAAFDGAPDGCLTFIQHPGPDAVEQIRASRAEAVMVPRWWAEQQCGDLDPRVIVTENPRLEIARHLAHHVKKPRGIHRTAIVEPGAEVHESAYVGAYSVIHSCVSIGPGVIIREHCTIGGDGFGFEPDEDGVPIHFPHVGTVEIQEGVEVFPHANIDRATLGVTIVRRHAKVDHHCHVSHGCDVGERCLLTSGVILGGGSVIGAGCYLGLGCIVKPKIRVGAGSTVGMGAVVIHDLPDGSTVAGVPARDLERK